MRDRAPLKSQNDTSSRSPEAKEALLRAAKKLFARQGLSGTTIRDIAFEAGTNSSQISYYFESKEGLYKACIQNIAETQLSSAGQILTPAKSKDEFQVRLRLFAENLFKQFLEDGDAGLIFIREFDRVNSPAENVFRERFIQLLKLIQSFFSQAIDDGYVSSDRDPNVMMSLFLGTVMNELRFDHLKQDIFSRSLRDKSEREKVIHHIVQLFTACP